MSTAYRPPAAVSKRSGSTSPRKCNPTRTHRHINGGAWTLEYKLKTVDIAGSAPQIRVYLNHTVETTRSAGSHVIFRNKLPIIETTSHA